MRHKFKVTVSFQNNSFQPTYTCGCQSQEKSLDGQTNLNLEHGNIKKMRPLTSNVVISEAKTF